MKLLSLLPLVVVLASCASSDFVAYRGEQKKWPTSSGAFAKDGYAVPAYYGPPERPYDVLGYIDATTAPIRRKGVVKYAASKAKAMGADAIIVVSEGSEFQSSFLTGSTVNTVGGSSFQAAAIPMYRGRAAVVAIRFRR